MPVSNYITPAGHAALARELEELWRVERPKVTQQVADAAALGDRSENAEYIYGKKRLREIDRRVRFLRKRLEVLKVVDRLPDNRDKAYFGAWVDVLDCAQDKELSLRLVGPDEIDTARGCISVDSPLGRALLGRQVDDEVRVKTPTGWQAFEVLAIRYGPA